MLISLRFSLQAGKEWHMAIQTKQGAAYRTISLIVPLHGHAAYAHALISFVRHNAEPQHVKEIVFINTLPNQQLSLPEEENKVKVITFTGATTIECLEAGAFEATGEVLFFIQPGTLPLAHFDKVILDFVQSREQAGILRNTSSSLWLKKLKSRLPTSFVLRFVKADNFFITRRMFHLKSTLQPIQKEFVSFSESIYLYAVSFRAKLV
jgi:hypothetical protein